MHVFTAAGASSTNGTMAVNSSGRRDILMVNNFEVRTKLISKLRDSFLDPTQGDRRGRLQPGIAVFKDVSQQFDFRTTAN